MHAATLERTDAQCGSDGQESTVRRLLVAVQDQDDRAWHAVGSLAEHVGGWSFRYFQRATEASWFLPLFGFDDVDRVYESPRLFPIFAQRLMSARRPDRPAYLQALALHPGASAFDVLARSGGRRAGDNVELLPVPTIDADGSTCAYFLVHGVRHVDGAADAITELHDGDRLDLVDDPANPKDAHALIVTSGTAKAVGYVPAPLLQYARAVRSAGGWSLTVERANGPEVGPHLRLLTCLSGRYPDQQAPFTGDPWHTA